MTPFIPLIVADVLLLLVVVALIWQSHGEDDL